MDVDTPALRLVVTLGDCPEGKKPFPLDEQTLSLIEAIALDDALWKLNPIAVLAMVTEIRALRIRNRQAPPTEVQP